ncbi:MAG: NADP-dependent oxidoreductase [Alphaproteobacteria bacterium]
MTNEINRRVLLRARPNGLPTPDCFELSDVPVERSGEGTFLLRNRFVSVDPAQKGWISAVQNYSSPVPIGAVMRAFGVGEVVESRHPDYAAGEWLLGMFGWQSHAVSDGREVIRRVDPNVAPPSTALGVLGHTGLSGYFGVVDILRPKAGETVVVSTAAGGVGSVAGQVARLLGAQTVGITSTEEKAKLCRETFGYDGMIAYRTAVDMDAALAQACPNGIDGYFDNVGGATLDAVLRRLNPKARIVICGTAATASWDPPPLGPRFERAILVNRARVEGMLIFDYQSRYAEGIEALSQWIREGRLNHREEFVDGLDKAPEALAQLYRSENLGKLVVRT